MLVFSGAFEAVHCGAFPHDHYHKEADTVNLNGSYEYLAKKQDNHSRPVDHNAQHVDGYEIAPGVYIPYKAYNFIWGIPAGEKRDLKFIKYLALAAYGPEVLAGSTIMGSKKGGRKAGVVYSRPSLDQHILQAIRDQLMNRVAEEEGVPFILEPEKHKRTNKLRFHEAIRGVQKVWREKGYGSGQKSNSFDEILLHLH